VFEDIMPMNTEKGDVFVLMLMVDGFGMTMCFFEAGNTQVISVLVIAVKGTSHERCQHVFLSHCEHIDANSSYWYINCMS